MKLWNTTESRDMQQTSSIRNIISHVKFTKVGFRSKTNKPKADKTINLRNSLKDFKEIDSKVQQDYNFFSLETAINYKKTLLQ